MIAADSNHTRAALSSTSRRHGSLSLDHPSGLRPWLVASLAVMVAWPVWATQSVTLTWKPSPDLRVTGYVLVYGSSSGSYDHSTDVGNMTEAAVTGLIEGRTYYFSAFAYAPDSLQSDFCNEVAYQVPAAATVASRLVFYNHSAWDNNDPAANANDDAAIAVDKSALLPGQTAAFKNYTSYSRGLNGVMIDILGLGPTVTAADFDFRVGNDSRPSSWPFAPAPTSITVRSGAGVGGSDRVTLIWPDNVIQGRWLQVTVLATSNTRLAAPDVFYFGNAIGEAGNLATSAAVTSADSLLALNNVNPLAGPITLIADFNRDRRVTSADALIALNGVAVGPSALQLITPSDSGAAPQGSPSSQPGPSLLNVAPAAEPAQSLNFRAEAAPKMISAQTSSQGATVALFSYPALGTVRVWQSATLEDWQEVPAEQITHLENHLYQVVIPADQAGPYRFFRFSSDPGGQVAQN